jgi:WhiB family redox-sensing transcriptional regulator
VICRRCPVILECAADALDNHVEFGVWGGMTERQRRALLKQHPEVVSWADFFAAQRNTAARVSTRCGGLAVAGPGADQRR